ncbi:MAG: hypothetical protein IJG46_05320, partial [Prevotella sp.]|nr:hypothetical protein [Prevotella sp.]
MDKKNDILLKNVELLSKLTKQEVKMMPATEAPLPSVEMVKKIVALVKNIIFPDYFNMRQPDEAIRSYYIGVHMEELHRLLTKQIAHGLQFCEDCFHSKADVYNEAERLSLKFIDALPEIKRLLYTDVQAMFDNDPEYGFETSFVKTGVMRNQRKTFDPGCYLPPYLRKNRCP